MSKETVMNEYKKRAKYLIKNDTRVKEEVSDLKHHFRTDKWPLNYAIYKSAMGVTEDRTMCAILDTAGFKVVYSSKDYALLIKPKAKSRL